MEKKPASEKQQKAAGQRQSNFGGMYILGIIFAIVAIGLIRVQLSVRYSMREESLSLLSKEELIRLKTEQSHIVLYLWYKYPLPDPFPPYQRHPPHE